MQVVYMSFCLGEGREKEGRKGVVKHEDTVRKATSNVIW